MRYLLLCTLLFLSCDLKKTWIETDVLYGDSEFMNGRLTVESGCQLLLTPLVYEGRFISKPSLDLLAKPLESRHDYVKIETFESFSNSLDNASEALLSLWKEGLLADDVLKMGEYTPVFRRNGIAFVQTIHIQFLASVKGEDGRIMRRVKLRGEIWGSEQRKVLFRAESELRSFNNRLNDEEVVLLAIKELYHLLPKFYFNTVHESW